MVVTRAVVLVPALVAVLATSCGQPPSAPACSTLGESGCLARTDCVPDYCFACSCTPGFAACRTAMATPFQCPRLGCPTPMCCESNTDCGGTNLVCIPPGGQSLGCGTCRNVISGCNQDSDCTGGDVCSPVGCACSPANECVPGCPTVACDPGTTCNTTTHRCQPTSCQGGGDCPRTFACVAGTCVKRTCTKDADCGRAESCVLGTCYTGMGVCGPNTPPA